MGENFRMRLAFAGVGFVITGCLVDNLTKEPPPGSLLPVGSLRHSVELGSLLAPVDTLVIRNAGGSPTAWVARTTGGSAWLSLPDPSGVTPDTLYVESHPSGLSVGVYRDTVIVSAVTVASSIAVSVELGIAAPPPPPIDTGVSPHLVFTTQPSNTAAGVPIAPPVVICMYGRFGGIDSGSDFPIRMTLIPPGTLLSTVTAISGCATFSDLVITTPGTYTLVGAKDPPPPVASSDSFTVTP